MQAKVFYQAPPVLVVLAVFSFLFVLLSRESFVEKDFPAFLPLNRDFLHVELTGAVVAPGVYQINDGLSLVGVIKMTDTRHLETNPGWVDPLQDGESIEIIKKGHKIGLLQRKWMPASHRVAVGILLHPDRMSFEDWQFLPGIGKALAARIEKDRQKNGDFVDIEGLLRVKGIGIKSINKWRGFFLEG